jgi:formylglycine-generating enzyme required for sulfatase activity
LIDVSGTPFMMGSPLTELGRYAWEPQHEVTLTRNFWLMTTEITQQQFLEVMGYNPSWFSAAGRGEDCGPDCPVELVDWHEVAAYTNGLSQLEGLGECYSCTGTASTRIDCTPSESYATAYDCPGYRLPTEAEWEYAARGGTTTATYNGDLDVVTGVSAVVEPIAWYSENSSDSTQPVGTKRANIYGLYDMLGNVWEWCHDWYESYPLDAEIDPPGAVRGSYRVVRGNSWSFDARNTRAADRGNSSPGRHYAYVGGRVARSNP